MVFKAIINQDCFILYLLFVSKYYSINLLCNFSCIKILAIGMHLILFFSSFLFSFILKTFLWMAEYPLWQVILIISNISTLLCCNVHMSWHVSCLFNKTLSETVAKWQVRIQKDMQIDTSYRYLCIFSTNFPWTLCSSQTIEFICYYG